MIQYIGNMKQKTGYTLMGMLKMIGISRCKYYAWKSRYGIKNRHNGNIPRNNWLTPAEREAIIGYARKSNNYSTNYLRCGYRRMTYQMIDEGIVAVSPSAVYGVLSKVGLMNKWDTRKKSIKGTGYNQPIRPHQEWHTDIKYVNFKGIFIFLICVLDGYSRYIIHHELRTHMTEYDVEITIQRAKEKYPYENPRLISDNGTQYISRDFQHYLKEVGLQHIRTSIGYPQSNGKIERFHRSIEEECLRKDSMIDLEDARDVVNRYVEYYNNKRLHSALFYLTPQDYLLGRVDEKLTARELKLKEASKLREEYWRNKVAA